MLTVFWHTLRESIHRRSGLVLMGVSALLPLFLLYASRIERQADGTLIAYSGRMPIRNIQGFVTGQFEGLFMFTAGPWTMLAVFVAGALLSSYLERGSPDLLFSKGVPRWQFFLGRYLGTLGLLVFVALVINGGTAFYFWARTGVSPAHYLTSLLLVGLNLAAVLALMALVAVAQPNMAVLVMIAYLQLIFSSILANRAQMLFPLISWAWVRTALDWAYNILPKGQELQRLGMAYLAKGAFDSWWPIWSTGVFIVVVLAASLWFLHRKSF